MEVKQTDKRRNRSKTKKKKSLNIRFSLTCPRTKINAVGKKIFKNKKTQKNLRLLKASAQLLLKGIVGEIYKETSVSVSDLAKKKISENDNGNNSNNTTDKNMSTIDRDEEPLIANLTVSIPTWHQLYGIQENFNDELELDWPVPSFEVTKEILSNYFDDPLSPSYSVDDKQSQKQTSVPPTPKIEGYKVFLKNMENRKDKPTPTTSKKELEVKLQRKRINRVRPNKFQQQLMQDPSVAIYGSRKSRSNSKRRNDSRQKRVQSSKLKIPSPITSKIMGKMSRDYNLDPKMVEKIIEYYKFLQKHQLKKEGTIKPQAPKSPIKPKAKKNIPILNINNNREKNQNKPKVLLKKNNTVDVKLKKAENKCVENNCKKLSKIQPKKLKNNQKNLELKTSIQKKKENIEPHTKVNNSISFVKNNNSTVQQRKMNPRNKALAQLCVERIDKSKREMERNEAGRLAAEKTTLNVIKKKRVNKPPKPIDSPEEGEILSDNPTPVKIIKIPVPINSVKDLNKMQVRRSTLEKFMYTPVFKTIAINAFVRISTTHSYQIAQVKSVVETQKVYHFGNYKTNIGFRCTSVNHTEVYRLEFISDKNFSENEFNIWHSQCLKKNIPLPTSDDLEQKLKDISSAQNYQLKHEDINYMVEQKDRFRERSPNYAMVKSDLIKDRNLAIKTGKYKTANLLDKEIHDVNTEIVKRNPYSTQSVTISYLNSRNRIHNIKAGEKARVEETTNLGPDHFDPFTRRQTRPRLKVLNPVKRVVTNEIEIQKEPEKKDAVPHDMFEWNNFDADIELGEVSTPFVVVPNDNRTVAEKLQAYNNEKGFI